MDEIDQLLANFAQMEAELAGDAVAIAELESVMAEELARIEGTTSETLAPSSEDQLLAVGIEKGQRLREEEKLGQQQIQSMDETAKMQFLDPTNRNDLLKLQQLVQGETVQLDDGSVMSATTPQARQFAEQIFRSGVPSDVASLRERTVGELSTGELDQLFEDEKFVAPIEAVRKGIPQLAQEALLGRETLQTAMDPETSIPMALLQTGGTLLSAPARAIAATGQADMSDPTSKLWTSDVEQAAQESRNVTSPIQEEAIRNLYTREQMQTDPVKKAQIRNLRRQQQIALQESLQPGIAEISSSIGTAGATDPLMLLDAPMALSRAGSFAGKLATRLDALKQVQNLSGFKKGSVDFFGNVLKGTEAGLNVLSKEGAMGASKAVQEGLTEGFVYGPETVPRDIAQKLVEGTEEVETVVGKFMGKPSKMNNQIARDLVGSLVDMAKGEKELAKVGPKYREAGQKRFDRASKARDIEARALGGEETVTVPYGDRGVLPTPDGVPRRFTKEKSTGEIEPEVVGTLGDKASPDVELLDFKNKWKDIDVKNQVSISPNTNTITLDKVIVPEDLRNTGIGTAYMNELLDIADQHGLQVALTPSADFGGTKSKLKKFYKRFGFIDNSGSAKDYSISETMYRVPSEKLDAPSKPSEVVKESFKVPTTKEITRKKRFQKPVESIRETTESFAPKKVKPEVLGSSEMDRFSEMTKEASDIAMREIPENTGALLNELQFKDGLNYDDLVKLRKTMDSEIYGQNLKASNTTIKKLKKLRSNLDSFLKEETEAQLSKGLDISDIIEVPKGSNAEQTYLNLRDELKDVTRVVKNFETNWLKSKSTSGMKIEDARKMVKKARKKLQQALNPENVGMPSFEETDVFDDLADLDRVSGTDFVERIRPLWEVAHYAEPIIKNKKVVGYNLPLGGTNPSNLQKALGFDKGIIGSLADKARGMLKLVPVEREALGTTKLAKKITDFVSEAVRLGIKPNQILDMVKIKGVSAEKVARFMEIYNQASKKKSSKQREGKLPSNVERKSTFNLSSLAGS